MSSENYDHIFKLLLIGDSGVGKSSILVRFTDDVFSEETSPTIGVDFKVKYIKVRNKRIKCALWDTAGQERFRTLTSSFYRGAHGVVLAYDVTSRESFENLKSWMDEVLEYSTFPDVVKLLVGNKIDLEEDRKVLRREGEQLAKREGMLFIECSAKTKEGIDQTFQEVCYQILDTESLVKNTRPVRLDTIDFKEKKNDDEEEDDWGWGCC